MIWWFSRGVGASLHIFGCKNRNPAALAITLCGNLGSRWFRSWLIPTLLPPLRGPTIIQSLGIPAAISWRSACMILEDMWLKIQVNVENNIDLCDEDEENSKGHQIPPVCLSSAGFSKIMSDRKLSLLAARIYFFTSDMF